MIPSDFVEKLFRSRWPRLYLDTAEFHNIGRGHTDAELVNRLLVATERHAVVLVVSSAHFRDALKPGNRDAPDLLASTLERFWIRGLVTRDPEAIEPWNAGPLDIQLSGWGNVREVLTAQAASPALAELESAQLSMFFANIGAKSAQKSAIETGGAINRTLSKEHAAIVAGATSVIGLGLVSRADDAVEIAARELGVEMTNEESFDLFKRVLPAEMVALMLSEYLSKVDPETRARMWSIMKAGPDTAPGLWLARQLSAHGYRNVDRGAQPSDIIDLEHCTYFPYVDIASCDRYAYAALAPHIAKAPGSRSVKLFRNGELHKIVSHIETLPTADMIRDAAIEAAIQRQS